MLGIFSCFKSGKRPLRPGSNAGGTKSQELLKELENLKDLNAKLQKQLQEKQSHSCSNAHAAVIQTRSADGSSSASQPHTVVTAQLGSVPVIMPQVRSVFVCYKSTKVSATLHCYHVAWRSKRLSMH